MTQPEVKYAEVAGKRVCYTKTGRGDPMILLHGLGNSLLQWEDILCDLSNNFTVYALDFPGFGKSDPAEKYEINTSYIPLFMRDFIEVLNIENPIIVGGSFGGLIALHYTLRYPSKVRKLVLMDSAGLGREIIWRWRFAAIPPIGELFAIFDSLDLRSQDSWLWRTVKLPYVGNKLEEMFYKLSKDNADQLRNDYKSSIKLLRHGVSIFGQRRRIVRTHMLHTLELPVMIMWGSEDRVFPVKHAYNATALIPNSTLHVFKGAHHWPPLEFPNEFSQVLLDFASK
ncbi:MAG: alpha/beta hydrolase [Candidatus Spechtbacterales bacterium]|nr:alpha/beta hydrolase [Candidatus Spechtbacterales bacterium]